MKIPWFNSKKKPGDRDKLSSEKSIPTANTAKPSQYLEIDGKKYSLNSLSDEIKQLISLIQKADKSINYKKNKMFILKKGKSLMLSNLSSQLIAVPEINSNL